MTNRDSVALRDELFATLKKQPSKIRTAEKLYDELKEQTTHEDGQILTKEISQLKHYAETADSILHKIHTQKDKANETILSIEREITSLDDKICDYEKGMSSNANEKQDWGEIERLKKQYVKTCEKRISLAQSLPIDKLKKLGLDDRKSQAHEPFRWIMVSIYGEPESKYYWPNFRAEAFENDKGLDLKQRLGKVSAVKAKEQQRLKTETFINDFEKISQCSELRSCQDQLQTILNIAKQFLASHDIGKKITGIQSRIKKRKGEIMEKDDEFMRWKARCDALKDRVQLNKQYLKVLEKSQSRLKGKPSKYQEKMRTFEDAADDLSLACKWSPTINVEDNQVKSGCACLF